MGLFSQKTFRVINRSDETLKYTLHPAPCTLNPAPCTLHPEPCTLNPEPYRFCFKQFASASAEIKARMRFGAGLNP